MAENINEFDENCLEWALKFKKKLRFEVGSLVYIRSDLAKKCPLTVIRILIFEEADYVCEWVTSQKELKRDLFIDKGLYQ